MIEHVSDKALAHILRGEAARLTSEDHPARPYLQARIDELDPPRPKLPENPNDGDVIDALFRIDPAHPERGATVRLFRICGVWMTKGGYKDINWPAVVHYDKVL